MPLTSLHSDGVCTLHRNTSTFPRTCRFVVTVCIDCKVFGLVMVVVGVCVCVGCGYGVDGGMGSYATHQHVVAASQGDCLIGRR